MNKYAIIIFVLLFFGIESLQAAAPRRIGQDYRSMAMGNTGIVAASTSVALHYNPAALANIDSAWFNVPAIELTADSDGLGIMQNLLAGVPPVITSFVGQSPYIKIKGGANFLQNISKKGTTFAMNFEYEHIIDFNVTDVTNFEYYESKDTIMQAGFSYPVGLGQFVLGASVRKVTREQLAFIADGTNFVGSVPVFSVLINPTLPSLAANGASASAVGYDFGMIYRLASKERWVVGAVYKGKLDFGSVLTTVPEEVSVGISTTRVFNNGLRFVGTVDYRDITQKNADLPTTKSRQHIGMEIGYVEITQTQSVFTVRAGLNQGYFTKGAEFALGEGMIFGYTEYAEEIGTVAAAVQSTKRSVGYFHLAF